MRKWKATMPKEAPRDGMVHVVFAFKTASGPRIEYTGQAAEVDMLRALNQITDAGIKAKLGAADQGGEKK